MKSNNRGGAYEAPRIEWLDVAVEAGFAISNEVGASTESFDNVNAGDSADEWN